MGITAFSDIPCQVRRSLHVNCQHYDRTGRRVNRAVGELTVMRTIFLCFSLSKDYGGLSVYRFFSPFLASH